MVSAEFLFDTNALIDLAERLSTKVIRRAEQCEPGRLVTSAIAFGEFVRGVDWSRPHAAETADRFFEAIPVLPFDEKAARIYADLPFKRHRFDRLIAAHALALDVTLVTSNVEDFAGLPAELKIEDWTK